MKLKGLQNSIRDSANCSKQYNWKEIQSYYDVGHSWRETHKHFGMVSGTLANAVKRGDLKCRSNSEGLRLHFKRFGTAQCSTSPESRKRTSVRQSLHNSGGKCKWFDVSGQSVQGTWERDFALWCNTHSIEWYKLKVNADVWPYESDGVQHSYTPDFYLPEYDIYLEIKGWYPTNDRIKMQVIWNTYPNRKLILVEKKQLQQILKGDKSGLDKMLTPV